MPDKGKKRAAEWCILRHGWSHPGRVPRLGALVSDTAQAVNVAMMAAYKRPGASSLSSSLCRGLCPRRLLLLHPVWNQDNAYEDLVEKLAIEDEAFSRSTTGPASPSPHQVEPDIVYVGDEHGLQSPCQQRPRDSTPFWR
ncbi:hypothetical protein N7501_007364 [Penicillium viridicatum]|nr:hypothetical protein N7501_007364 [Penicillium viridicatum]